MVGYADTISSAPFHVIIRMQFQKPDPEKTINPLPADAVAIPADARAFHLPPTASLSHDQQRHAVDIANAV